MLCPGEGFAGRVFPSSRDEEWTSPSGEGKNTPIERVLSQEQPRDLLPL